MFIYKAEKEEMQRSITFLLGEFSKLWSDHLVLKAKIKALEEKRPTQYVWTEDQRKAQSDRMKNAWAKKREPRV
jgi:hypothetical protein